jgi:hypothetical protein
MHGLVNQVVDVSLGKAASPISDTGPILKLYWL